MDPYLARAMAVAASQGVNVAALHPVTGKALTKPAGTVVPSGARPRPGGLAASSLRAWSMGAVASPVDITLRSRQHQVPPPSIPSAADPVPSSVGVSAATEGLSTRASAATKGLSIQASTATKGLSTRASAATKGLSTRASATAAPSKQGPASTKGSSVPVVAPSSQAPAARLSLSLASLMPESRSEPSELPPAPDAGDGAARVPSAHTTVVPSASVVKWSESTIRSMARSVFFKQQQRRQAAQQQRRAAQQAAAKSPPATAPLSAAVRASSPLGSSGGGGGASAKARRHAPTSVQRSRSPSAKGGAFSDVWDGSTVAMAAWAANHPSAAAGAASDRRSVSPSIMAEHVAGPSRSPSLALINGGGRKGRDAAAERGPAEFRRGAAKADAQAKLSHRSETARFNAFVHSLHQHAPAQPIASASPPPTAHPASTPAASTPSLAFASSEAGSRFTARAPSTSGQHAPDSLRQAAGAPSKVDGAIAAPRGTQFLEQAIQLLRLPYSAHRSRDALVYASQLEASTAASASRAATRVPGKVPTTAEATTTPPKKSRERPQRADLHHASQGGGSAAIRTLWGATRSLSPAAVNGDQGSSVRRGVAAGSPPPVPRVAFLHTPAEEVAKRVVQRQQAARQAEQAVLRQQREQAYRRMQHTTSPSAQSVNRAAKPRHGLDLSHYADVPQHIQHVLSSDPYARRLVAHHPLYRRMSSPPRSDRLHSSPSQSYRLHSSPSRRRQQREPVSSPRNRHKQSASSPRSRHQPSLQTTQQQSQSSLAPRLGRLASSSPPRARASANSSSPPPPARARSSSVSGRSAFRRVSTRRAASPSPPAQATQQADGDAAEAWRERGMHSPPSKRERHKGAALSRSGHPVARSSLWADGLMESATAPRRRYNYGRESSAPPALSQTQLRPASTQVNGSPWDGAATAQTRRGRSLSRPRRRKTHRSSRGSVRHSSRASHQRSSSRHGRHGSRHAQRTSGTVSRLHRRGRRQSRTRREHTDFVASSTRRERSRSRSPHSPHSRSPHSPYSRSPYSRSPYSRMPRSRTPRSRTPHSRTPHSRTPHSRSPRSRPRRRNPRRRSLHSRDGDDARRREGRRRHRHRRRNAKREAATSRASPRKRRSSRHHAERRGSQDRRGRGIGRRRSRRHGSVERDARDVRRSRRRHR